MGVKEGKKQLLSGITIAALLGVLIIKDSELLSLGALLIAIMIGAAMWICEFEEKEEREKKMGEVNTIEMTERVIQATAELTGRSVDRLWENWHALAKANGYRYSCTLVDFLASNFQSR